MRRLFTSILLLVYFTVNTGFVINLHYCMDKMASIELGSSQKEKCGKCGMPASKKAGCCHDVIKVVKLNIDQVQVYSVAYNVMTPTLLLLSFFIEAPLRNACLSLSHKAHAPPLIYQHDLYLTNCVFRI